MNRFHIEERDHEMDLWLRLGSAKASDQHRNLTLVVTVFKKNCNARDPHFRHCRHTDYCVRNEYFCDSYANCAWPSGDSATDEDYCDGSEWVPSGFGSGMSNGALNASNIPIIIIVIIVVVGVIIVFAVGISHFIKTFKASSPSDELSGSSATSSATRANRRPRPSGQEASAPMLLSEGSGGPASPSAPPSYEEALKTQPVVMTVDPKLDPPELPAHPPPYSEQAETRTGFI